MFGVTGATSRADVNPGASLRWGFARSPSHRVGRSITPAILDQIEQPPPVHCAVQYTNNRDAVGSRAVENQYILEVADSPFSEPDELWVSCAGVWYK